MKENLKNRLIRILKIKIVDYSLKFAHLLFKEAKTQKDLEAVYRTRYKIYKESGYIEANKEEIFKDKYDPYSVNFLILKNERPIGTARLVLNSKVGFPTEYLFNFKRPEVPIDKIAEISRLAIEKEFRGGSRIVMTGLIKMIYSYTKSLGIDFLYANMPERLEQSFRAFGIKFQELREEAPTEANLKAREIIGGYFKQKRLKPYILDIKKAKQTFGL